MSFKVTAKLSRPRLGALTRLSNSQVDRKLADLPGWKREGDFITKSFSFDEFMEGIGFVNEVAAIAERLDHHPDIKVVWTTVTLQIQTHDEGGLTQLDLELAAEIEKRLGQRKVKTTKK